MPFRAAIIAFVPLAWASSHTDVGDIQCAIGVTPECPNGCVCKNGECWKNFPTDPCTAHDAGHGGSSAESWMAQPSQITMSAEELARAEATFERVMAAHANRSDLSASASSCKNDFRPKVPACQQYEHMWCWATCSAQVASFFKDVGVKGNDCHGVECKIVGHASGKSCCSDKDSCGQQGGSGQDMADAIQWMTGGKAKYAVKNGPLSQAQLDTILSKGYPILTAFYWKHSKMAHVTTLAGCTGDGRYYLHDSDNGGAGSYIAYSYHDVAYYATDPIVPDDYRGKWYMTVYPADALSEEETDLLV